MVLWWDLTSKPAIPVREEARGCQYHRVVKSHPGQKQGSRAGTEAEGAQ